MTRSMVIRPTSFPRSSTTGADTRSYFSNAFAACAAGASGVKPATSASITSLIVVAGALLTSMCRGMAPRTICRVSTTKSRSVWSGISGSERKVLENLRHRLRLAHDHHVLRHEAADGILIVVAGVLQPGTILRRERLGHLFEYILRSFAGEKCQVVGVERAERAHELIAIQFLDERGSNRLARLDQRCARLLRLELPKHQQAIVGGQRIEDHGNIGRVLEPQVTLQLGKVLTMLHLLEQVVSRGLLAAGERRQHPMTVEQAHDLVAKVVTGLTRGFG